MRRIAIVSLVLAALSGACKPAGSRVHFDPTSFMPKLAAQMERVLNEPAVSAGFDELLGAIAADPTLRARGTALLGSIAEDPAIAAPAAAVLSELQSDPALQRVVSELMTANPGTSPDQIGELVGKRVEATWDSPLIGAAWMRCWDRLRARLTLGQLPALLEAGISKRIERHFAASGERWGERVIALNGGEAPSAERAAEIYIDHAWSEDRFRRFVRAALASPALRREVIAALQRLIALPAVERELRTAAQTLIADPGVQHAAIELLGLLISSAPAPAAVEQALDRLLLPAPVIAAFNKLLTGILAEPAVPGILVDAFDHLAADPQLAAIVHDLLEGW
jgi:hypothetical protein